MVLIACYVDATLKPLETACMERSASLTVIIISSLSPLSPSPVSFCPVVSPHCWTAGTCLSLCFLSTSSLSSTSFVPDQTAPIFHTIKPHLQERWSPMALHSLQKRYTETQWWMKKLVLNQIKVEAAIQKPTLNSWLMCRSGFDHKLLYRLHIPLVQLFQWHAVEAKLEPFSVKEWDVWM